MTRVPNAGASLSLPKILVALLLFGAAGLYASGYFFLWAIKEQPATATPLTTIRYWYYYGDRADVRKTLVFSLAGGLGLTFGLGVLALIPKKRPLHGDARFATKREIRKAGLLGQEGIILARYGNEYVTLPGQQGVELEAPPRSGKGVGLVIPNLLNWPGSVIVNDIKGENWQRTAGFRAQHGQQVHLFDPLAEDLRSSRWNPLAYVSTVPYKCIDDLQRIASMLYPDPQGSDPFWTSSARSLFLGIGLYLFENEGTTRTIGEILRQGMASDAEGFQKHWRRVIDTCEKAGYPLSPQAVQTLYDVIDLAPVTASSIRKTFTSRLDLWMNPLIDAATSANDFDFRELRKRPISIYCRINPDNIARLQPLLNLFFQQAIGLQTKELPEHNPELKVQLMLLMDEFKSLGRIPVIADSTAFLPGYNVRTVIIVQAHSQIIEVYGPEGAKSLRKMLAARIVFPPKEFDEAEAISKELGTYTVKQKSRSNRMFDGKSATVNTSDQPRRLMLPQEIKELGVDKLILFYEGLRPVLAGRIYYYRDKFFSRREIPPPEVPRLNIEAVKRLPSPTPQQMREEEAEGAGGSVAPAAWTANTIAPATASGPAQATSERRLAANEVAALDQLSLDDFSLDFDHVVIPKSRPMTEEEVQGAVNGFLASLVD